MSNRLSQRSVSKLIENKTRVVLGILDRDLSAMKSNEREEILLRYNSTYQLLMNSLSGPLFSPSEFKRGMTVEVSDLNREFQSIKNDLDVVFSEMTNIRKQLKDTYNTLLTKESRTRTKIAEVTSAILDYSLLNQSNGNLSIKDSFLTLQKIEPLIKRYKQAKMFIDTDTGFVTLPHDSDDELIKLVHITISPLSNGVLGNNQEINTIRNDDILAINDENMDTWVEYEHVQKEKHRTGLVLEFELEFKEISFFNSLELMMRSFPNGSNAGIVELVGSVDGEYYIDLMKDYLGDLETDARGQEIIQTGVKEGSPQNLSSLLFFPRKLKYIKIKMVQDSDYAIRTASGVKHRMAIGISEITCKGIKFANKGEFQSISHPISKEVQKVMIDTSEYRPEGFIVKNDYQISIDAGQSWNPILPLSQVNLDIPEILTFNLDHLEDSITTPAPVRNLKLKVLSEITLGEGDTTPLSVKTLKAKTEFKRLSGGEKDITLEEKPESDVKVFNVGFGSVGEGEFYRMPASRIFDREDCIVGKLPAEVFSRNSIKEDSEVVYIEDVVWKRVPNLFDSISTDRAYEFDYLNNRMIFYRERTTTEGEGDQEIEITKRFGKKPLGDILFRLESEEPVVVELPGAMRLDTRFSHNGIENQIKVFEKGMDEETLVLKLSPLTQSHKLINSYIGKVEITQDSNSRLVEEKTFLNGYDELTTPGDYSIDYFRGMLYTFEISRENDLIELEISYNKKTAIDFSIKDSQIEIKKEDYNDRLVKTSISVSESQVINLPNKSIKTSSIQILKDNENLQEEVPYALGTDPFDGLAETSGRYAINYEEGKILLPKNITTEIDLSYLFYDYVVEYGISLEIPKTDYVVEKENRRVVFSDSYVLKYFSDSLGLSSNHLFKVSYDFLIENKESPAEVLPFLTPVMYDYIIKMIFKD